MAELSFKVILVGQSGVGKTAIVRRFTKRFFPSNDLPTIGVDVGVKVVDCDGTKVQMKIWDSAGSEKFKSITRSYYRNADAAILVYSITDCGSLYDLQSWSREVMSQTDAIRILVGNKNDLESDRKISQELAITFGLLENMEAAIECSAKEDDNVDFLFNMLAKKLLAKHKQRANVGQGGLQKRDDMLQYPGTTVSMSNLFISPNSKRRDEGPEHKIKKNFFQRLCSLF